MEDIKFNFEDLRVYEKALDFIDSVYSKTKDFPVEERFRLTSQFIRAATSIALNIAEGSIKECVVCCTIAKRQNFISVEDDKNYRFALSTMAKMIINLRKYLK